MDFMHRVVQKSRALARGDAGEILPPFIVREPVEQSLTRAQPAKPREPSRWRLLLAKLLRGLAYTCLALGVAAVLGVIAAAIILYYQNHPSQSSAPLDGGAALTASGYSSGGWIWLMLGGLAPGFAWAFAIFFGILALMLVIWVWRTALHIAERLVARLADELIKPVALVEPIAMLTVWAGAIIGLWLLPAVDVFLPLAVVSLALLALGLISLWIFRALAGARLDIRPR